MKSLRALGARFRGLFAGASADADMREEFESHLAMHIEENLRRGMNADDARRDALIASGGLTVAAEAVRERRGLPWVETLVADLRYAFRTLRLNKAYSAAVVLTVALGIGANAAMFTIVNAVILRPLPYPEPDRLVAISVKDKSSDLGVVPGQIFAEWGRSAKSVAVSTSAVTDAVFTFASGAGEETGVLAEAGYFSVLAGRPEVGRVFTAEEDRPGGPEVIVLSDQLWRRSFGGDHAVVGKTITVDGKPTTVVGVMPASYSTSRRAQFWAPYRMDPPSSGATHYYFVYGRLRDGWSIDAARAELASLTTRVGDREGLKDLVPVVMTMHERRYGEARTPLLLLFAAVGVLLLIACANLANLALARAARREREFVVRLALGAGRWRVMRHVLCESLLLSATGAVLGLALSVFAVRYFVRLSPQSVARVEGIHVDARVLVFTLVVALVTALLFGLVPANSAGRGNLSLALASGSGRAAGSRRHQLLRRFLVVAQLATALMLLTGAGVVARTFWRVTSLDLGFRPENLLTVRVALPRARYQPEMMGPFFDDLLSRVQREPGVVRASLVNVPPLSGVSMSVSTTDSAGHKSPLLDVVGVGTGYLETIGSRLAAGRMIGATDGPNAPKVVVINETAARLLFPDGHAVGQVLKYPTGTVVGVVKDIRQRQLESAVTPVIYLPSAQDGKLSRMQLVVRTAGDPEALENGVRRVVRAIDPALALPVFETMESKFDHAIAPRRFTFVLLGMFALVAGALAIIGLYGVLSYLVAERTREIGIRIALGADASRVRRLVIGQGMTLTAVGIVIGVVGSTLAARTLQSMVYEMSVYDTRAFVAGATILGVVAYLACYIPARRASRVDPILALRAE